MIQKIKKTAFVLFSITVLHGCLNLMPCPESLEGRYESNYFENAENYLLIRNDGTFLHYFKQGSIELTDKGLWEKSNNGYCQLELSSWKDFNKSGKDYKTYGNGILFISGEYLNITPDGENSFSFKKIDD